MEALSKENIKKIKKGNFGALINGIECLLDTYNEDKYELGYNACMADIQVYARRLAERLSREAKEKGVKSDKKGYYLLDEDEVREITEKFFDEYIELNKKNEIKS